MKKNYGSNLWEVCFVLVRVLGASSRNLFWLPLAEKKLAGRLSVTHGMRRKPEPSETSIGDSPRSPAVMPLVWRSYCRWRRRALRACHSVLIQNPRLGSDWPSLGYTWLPGCRWRASTSTLSKFYRGRKALSNYYHTQQGMHTAETWYLSPPPDVHLHSNNKCVLDTILSTKDVSEETKVSALMKFIF